VTVGCVVVAAGLGERLGEAGPKALVPLGGRSLLVHSLDALRRAGLPPVVVVHTPGAEAAFRADLDDLPVAALVPGGATRTESVRAGVAALAADVSTVAVHDAARPLMPADVIRRTVAAVTGDVVAAAPAISVADTLKRIAGPLTSEGSSDVLSTIDRAGVVGVQTPQVFPRAVLEEALRQDEAATDDLALVERLLASGTIQGRAVVVAGSPRGLKVTYPDDLRVAAALLEVGT
jgi:2-C-methyl-D-erythritol 4-phosphate cytidylyltransferase